MLRAVPGSRMNAGGHHGPVNGPGPGPVCEPYPTPTPVALTEHQEAKKPVSCWQAVNSWSLARLPSQRRKSIRPFGPWT